MCHGSIETIKQCACSNQYKIVIPVHNYSHNRAPVGFYILLFVVRIRKIPFWLTVFIDKSRPVSLNFFFFSCSIPTCLIEQICFGLCKYNRYFEMANALAGSEIFILSPEVCHHAPIKT